MSNEKTTRITISTIQREARTSKAGNNFEITKLIDQVGNEYEGFSDETTKEWNEGDVVEVVTEETDFGTRFRVPRERIDISDVLDMGEYPMEFTPVTRKDGDQVSGTTKYGSWYMYKTEIDGKEVVVFANDDNKKYFDSGTVKVVVKHKEIKGEPAYKVVEGNPIPVKIVFYNENK